MKSMKWLFGAFFPLLMTSCLVSQKKYDIAENGRLAAIYSRDSLEGLLATSRTDFATLSKDFGALTEKFNSLTREHNNLMEDTTQLRKGIRNYQTMLSANKSEKEDLMNQLNQRMQELDERQHTIQQLQGIVNEQNQRVRSLLDNLKQALNGFSSDELTVREEGGKVYVAMSDKLLFESGKAVVNAQGKQALGKLAEVLNRQTDIDVFIEGHTDSIPIKTAVFQDNWDLSVIRATSVVRILTEVYAVNPLQILPCGRGEFKPVDSNKAAEGRARNRRTEIIIAPRLDKLYELIAL
ncbi:MAG: OmpA family protein [Bacteroidaceae bacterium]|nr:OmpA family protein [Bacteroidaceae bacterium]